MCAELNCMEKLRILLGKFHLINCQKKKYRISILMLEHNLRLDFFARKSKWNQNGFAERYRIYELLMETFVWIFLIF